MKKMIIGGSALLGLIAAPALAADLAPKTYTKAPPLPVPAVYDWTGGYIGVEGGFGWGHSDQTDPGIAPPPPPPPNNPPPVGDGHYSVNGGLVGGTLGYNWQFGPWVFGLEGDYSWSDIKGQSSVCGPTTVLPHLCGTSLDSLGTLRGRVGYAVGAYGNWLLYGTGGLAVGEVHAFDALTPAAGNNFRAGWAVGAGIETAFAPSWTAKLEYLYVDLGSTVYFNIVPGVPETVSFTSNIIRAGVNYRFGGPVVARY
jgi:outer membrane immunogenic protein